MPLVWQATICIPMAAGGLTGAGTAVVAGLTLVIMDVIIDMAGAVVVGIRACGCPSVNSLTGTTVMCVVVVGIRLITGA